MTKLWFPRASLLAIALGLISPITFADDDKNESGKAGKRSSEVHQRDIGRTQLEPRAGLDANERIDDRDRNRGTYSRKERRDDDKADRDARYGRDTRYDRDTRYEREYRYDRDGRVDSGGRGDRHDDRSSNDRDSSKSKVPNGHLPPPGECRIWYSDRPAGHQPPPGDCRTLSQRVPYGARLIRN